MSSLTNKARVCAVGVLSLLFMLSSSLYGQRDVRDATVQVDGCSGVCVHPSGLIMTANHCDHKDTVTVEFERPPREVTAHLVYRTEKTEGPVVFDCEGEGYPYALVGDAVPMQFSPVWSCGYPEKRPGVNVRSCANGILLRGGSFEYRGGTFNGNIASFYTGSGWSGGPLFNSENRVIGLLSSGSDVDSVYISFTDTRAAYDTALQRIKDDGSSESPVDAAGGRPTLYVFTDKACIPCQRFKDDYATDHNFRRALQAMYFVRFVDIDTEPGLAARFNVTRAPTFAREGFQNVVDYTTKADLMAALLRHQSIPAEDEVPLEDVEQRPAPDLEDDVEVPIESGPDPPPDDDEALTEDGELETLAKSVAIILARMNEESSLQEDTEVATSPPEEAGESEGGFLSSSTFGTLMSLAEIVLLLGAGGSGIGLGVGGAIGVAKLASRLFRVGKKVKGVVSDRNTAAHQVEIQSKHESDWQSPAVPFPRDLEEARQLYDLRLAEGRIPLLDALGGAFLEDERDKIHNSGSDSEKAVIDKVYFSIRDRLNKIAKPSTRGG